MPPAADEVKRRAARETIDILEDISSLLNTDLDRKSLSYCVSLIEHGVNPEALANMIQTLRAKYPQEVREDGKEG
ncbi:mitotic-spindle organizing protein [Elsinoe australis]|uniref:Mitotic-spindle organizing protein 1 n=1 Tax=Elsinoe australis TaxID=40998 RepID=A0A4U7AYX0_9PEZI|nr:mitotic-spindle organizing protein [Elsinoe australis]